jgi:HK97 family phage prohead protease
MPAKPHERQYRSLLTPLAPVSQGAEKRFDSEYYVEGYASTFNDPYLLYKTLDGIDVYEVIDPDAFRGCDMSDVIFQFDHAGRVYARQSNETLVVEPQLHGLFIAADLGSTSLSRQMFEDIDAKLITRMSWAFMPVWDSIEDVYDEESKTLTSTIHEVERVYDVSAVSLPADPNTEISARSYFDGAIERIAAERLQSVLEAQKAIELRRKRMELRAKSMQLRH